MELDKSPKMYASIPEYPLKLNLRRDFLGFNRVYLHKNIQDFEDDDINTLKGAIINFKKHFL